MYERLADLIRINQLVRGRIDFEGFQAWCIALPPEQRRELTCLLCEFADQAGVDDALRDEAMLVSGVAASDPFMRHVLSVPRADSGALACPLWDLASTVSDDELPTIFRMSVYMFGTAEGRRYRDEEGYEEHCNHWWHRDLLDERVVHDLLSDPRYYMTQRKDDARLKRQV